jgi:hypothetical protein
MEIISESNCRLAQAEIARCAYLIWEGEGRPEGRAIAHWLQAEEQLLAAGRIIPAPQNFSFASDPNSKPTFQRRRYGLVLAQKISA